MLYSAVALPFNTRRLPSGELLAVSASGDHILLANGEEEQIRRDPSSIFLDRQALLRSLFFLGSDAPTPGQDWLLKSRIGAKRETTNSGPALHIIVPTLQCAHSCRYCQVSRSLDDSGHAMSVNTLDRACASIFESPSPALTVEFQGGDPLLRFDLIRHAVLRISEINSSEKRSIRFVVASTLHQLTAEMCEFFRTHNVFLSTSIDGPSWLHNKNRPTPTRDAYERTVAGIELARHAIGADCVSALMTTTRESLPHATSIVDEYVKLGLNDIFLRPLSSYGFAKRNQALLGYSLPRFADFYERAVERVLHWNRQGVELREIYGTIILNKILCTFDSGYVDLQSPTGAGSSVLVYNYDGYVYPSDEARMIAETGDVSLRLGPIGKPLSELRNTKVYRDLVSASTAEGKQGCVGCTYNGFCAPNPVDAQAQFGDMFAAVATTEHCQRHLALFDYWFSKVSAADDWHTDLYYRWATPATARSES